MIGLFILLDIAFLASLNLLVLMMEREHMSADIWPAEVGIATKITGVPDVDMNNARRLLDKAIQDYVRAEQRACGSGAEPLYLPEIRWEMVRLARRMLGEA